MLECTSNMMSHRAYSISIGTGKSVISALTSSDLLHQRSQVNLYWTGNQVVLKGWASKEGIPRLFVDSEKCLKTVNIFWSPVSAGL